VIAASCGLKKSKGIIAGSPKRNREGAADLSGSKVVSAALKLLLDNLLYVAETTAP